MNTIPTTYKINSDIVYRPILALGVVLTLLYGFIIFWWLPKGELWLYWLLMAGEIFHIWLILSYIFTIWPRDKKSIFEQSFCPPVDIFITVAGEPADIVKKTVVAAKNIKYSKKNIHILNDGFVCGSENWKEIESLGESEAVNVITRKIGGGAKAGNINNALKLTKNPFIAVFDADHIPKSEFLSQTMGYFIDKKMAFVQTPQYYGNFLENDVTIGASEQQELFFGPILEGKNNSNSVFMCGTNMILNRKALDEVGGLCDTNIAEDFLTSLFIHEKGWKSTYVAKILASGLAPSDFLSYYKQQFRWARGSLEVIFKYNPIFRAGLSFQQKLHYLVSASYYLSGIFVMVNMMVPIIYLLFQVEPLKTSTMTLALSFLPYLFICIYILQKSSNSGYTFKALSFSMGSFFIFTSALISVLLNRKVTFAVTSKQTIQGNFVNLIFPQLVYFGICTFTSIFYLVSRGLTPSFITNFSWIFFNNIVFFPFILAALPPFEFAKIFNLQRETELINEGG
jgi:cellulose synthase (UDP-forming)